MNPWIAAKSSQLFLSLLVPLWLARKEDLDKLSAVKHDSLFSCAFV